MASAVYDFRHSADGERQVSKEALVEWCRKWGKRYVFQLEKSDKGYVHWQGRISLAKKREKSALLKILDFVPMYFEPCSTNTLGDAFYCTKQDTRIEGPFRDTDVEDFMPDQFAPYVNKLLPWQQKMWDMIPTFEPRLINLVYDPTGNNGKTVLAALAELQHVGIDLPPVNDMKEIMQMMLDETHQKTRRPGSIFIDLPRAMDKSRLHGIYAAIEQIKKGKLYDGRYSFRKWWIHSPQIFVFTNCKPDMTLLSNDRWRLFMIEDRKLRDYIITEEDSSSDTDSD